MAKPIRVTIRGPADAQSEAPSVDDLLDQIRDIVDVLRGVERATEEGGQRLDWRVTDARMNSPISIELTPVGNAPAAVVLARAERVERNVANGFRELRGGNLHPQFFSNDILQKARRVHARVLNGLSDTVLDFEDGPENSVVIDPEAARRVRRAIETDIASRSAPYAELGSIEGFVTKPELDGHGRAVLRFKARLGGEEIKAYASSDAAFSQVEALRLSDVWHGLRVRVYGTIHYKSLGVVEVMNATGIEVLGRDSLPGTEDIVDPDFTGGLTSEEFLRELRAYG